MEFNNEDFSEMLFNPKLLSGKEKMIQRFPDLGNMFGEIDYVINCDHYGGIENVLKYICFMYDSRTPLRKITQYRSRKKKAMQLAGYTFDEDGQIVENRVKGAAKKKGNKVLQGDGDDGFVQNTRTPYRDMMLGKSHLINRMVVLYLRRFRNHEFAYLVAMEEAYFRNMEKIMHSDNSATEDKNALALIESVKVKIDTAYQDVFLSKPDSTEVEEVFMVIEEEKMGISPEDIARRLKAGEYIRPL